MANIYSDGSYLKNNPDWHLTDSRWKAGQLSSILNHKFFAALPPRTIRILDVGCGAGGVLKYFGDDLKTKGIKIEAKGYEISDDAIKLAKQQFPQLNISKNEPFSANYLYDYDIILAVDVLEHLDDPPAFLQKISQHTYWILFHIPLDDNIWGRIKWGRGYYKYLTEDRSHLHYFNKNSALNFLRNQNLNIKKWKYTFWGIDLEKSGGISAPFIKFARKVGFVTLKNLSVYLLGGASLAVLASTPLNKNG